MGNRERAGQNISPIPMPMHKPCDSLPPKSGAPPFVLCRCLCYVDSCSSVFLSVDLLGFRLLETGTN